MHYLNNAGASLLTEKTRSAILEHLDLEQEIGAYVAAERKADKMQAFYERASQLLNAENASCIFYCDSASRGLNVILNSLKINKNERIVTFSSEFGTNLVSLYRIAESAGAELSIIECDVTGKFRWEELKNAITSNTTLLCISHAAAHGSIINPVNEIGTFIRDNEKCTFVVDGCQSAGQLQVDVQTIGCDAYICTGRKWLRGPRGTGFAYVKENAAIRSTHFDLAAADLILDQDSQITGLNLINSARQFELWERSVALMLGLSEAISESLAALQAGLMGIANSHAKKIRQEILNNPNLILIGEVNSPSCIAGFICKAPSFEDGVKKTFNERNLNYSSMGDWDCPLHFPRNGVTTIFRLSPHHYTSEETIDTALDAIRSLR